MKLSASFLNKKRVLEKSESEPFINSQSLKIYISGKKGE